MDALSITIVMLVFLLAGGVKGVVGLGLPTVAVALLSAVFGIEAALPLLVIPSFVTNAWQGAVGGHALALLRRFGVALAIIPVTTWIGYHYIFIAAPAAMERVLGAVLILYAGAGLATLRLTIPAETEPVLTPLVGVVNGLVTGVTGTFTTPLVMYLEALGLDRDELVQMMGIAFSVSTAALASVLILHGAYRIDAGYVSAAAVLPAIAGMMAGARVRARLTPAAFRKWLLIALALLASSCSRASEDGVPKMGSEWVLRPGHRRSRHPGGRDGRKPTPTPFSSGFRALPPGVECAASVPAPLSDSEGPNPWRDSPI